MDRNNYENLNLDRTEQTLIKQRQQNFGNFFCDPGLMGKACWERIERKKKIKQLNFVASTLYFVKTALFLFTFTFAFLAWKYPMQVPKMPNRISGGAGSCLQKNRNGTTCMITQEYVDTVKQICESIELDDMTYKLMKRNFDKATLYETLRFSGHLEKNRNYTANSSSIL